MFLSTILALIAEVQNQKNNLAAIISVTTSSSLDLEVSTLGEAGRKFR